MADLADLRARVVARAEKAVARAAPRLEARLQATSPVDTGLMRSRTSVRPRGLRVGVVVDTDYATYVRDGTRPHVIVPRNARVLRFVVDGQTVFARRVNHPGTDPNPWYERAITAWPRLVEEHLD